MNELPAQGSPGDMPGAVSGEALAAGFVKTDAGRAEIRQRALPLSRPARNLLLIIDASRSAEGWLGMVQGCGPAELLALIDAGLVAPTLLSTAAAAPRMSLAQALEQRDPKLLCRRMLAEARPRLGRVKGYWLALEVERSESPADVRALAQRFVEQLRQAQGDAAAVALAQVLIAPES